MRREAAPRSGARTRPSRRDDWTRAILQDIEVSPECRAHAPSGLSMPPMIWQTDEKGTAGADLVEARLSVARCTLCSSEIPHRRSISTSSTWRAGRNLRGWGRVRASSSARSSIMSRNVEEMETRTRRLWACADGSGRDGAGMAPSESRAVCRRETRNFQNAKEEFLRVCGPPQYANSVRAPADGREIPVQANRVTGSPGCSTRPRVDASVGLRTAPARRSTPRSPPAAAPSRARAR